LVIDYLANPSLSTASQCFSQGKENLPENPEELRKYIHLSP